MRSFTLNDMRMEVASSQIDLPEPQPRLSRLGVGGGLGIAVVALVLSASSVRPSVLPTDPEALVSFAAWWVANVLTFWLALSLAVWMLVLGRPARSHGGWVRMVTLPGSRQLTEAMFAVAVIAIPVACSAGAAQVAPPRIEVLSGGFDSRSGEALADSTTPPASTEVEAVEEESGFSAGVGTLSDAPPTTLLADSSAPVAGPADLDVEAGSSLAPGLVAGLQDEGTEGGSQDGTVDMPTEPSVAVPTGTVYVVARGDNFWAIADAHLTLVRGSSPTNSQIATYWRQMVDANRTTITSGNPDLIYPGEQIVLPSVFTE